ncbi:MAG TPA: manganese efflux pump MntP family protein [Spirochaetales bacterium]|nr:manganese efflux pump MntP family protein [Spirochaetales bacterium]
MLTYIVAGVALAMDAFAVSVSAGICIADLRFRHAARTAFTFGLFQFLMPLAGYALGSTFSDVIRAWDHWVAFGLLAFVGGKMIVESFEIKDAAVCTEDELRRKNVLDPKTLLVLAVATSIDALAVGVGYSMIGAPIWAAAGIIGVVTFGLCLLGCEFGKRLGARFERGAEIAGGVVLIGIGLKILAEHLSA